MLLCSCNSDTGKETKKKNEERILDIKDGSFVVPSPSPSARPVDPQTGVPTLNSIPGVIGATYTVTGTSEGGALVRIYVDDVQTAQGNAAADGAWSINLTGLAAGSITITADATAVGKTSSNKTDGRTTTVDTTAPPVPVVTGPASPVTIAQPDITGTGEAGTTTIVFLDGTEIDDVVVAAGGNWSYPLPVPLIDGTYTVTVKGRDIAGNESALSAGFDFTIELPAP